MGNLGDATVHTRSVLKPYGVWGVISPFNFPFALSGGPAGGALVAGNTVVYKPSSDAPLSGVLPPPGDARRRGSPTACSTWSWARARRSATRSRRTPASTASSSPARSRSGSGCTRASPGPTRSRSSSRWAARTRRSCRATPTSTRRPRGSCARAFGFSGQKCSANSRVYVERPVHDELVRRLVEKTEAITIGDPTDRRNWLGPVINAEGRRALRAGRRRGARGRAAGDRRRAGDRERARARASSSRRPWRPTCPRTTACSATSCSSRSRRSRRSTRSTRRSRLSNDYEPRAHGRRSTPRTRPRSTSSSTRSRPACVYVNRRAGATTGAWPGIQPFGGWKGSTATGKAGGGFYYVQQFMREQSQTIVD